MKIIIRHLREGVFRVDCDDAFADELTADEALGCVASALFANHTRPLFVRTHEQHEEWKRYLARTRGETP